MKLTNDFPAEAKMEQFGAKFRVQVVKLSDIDWTESKTNGARLNDPLNEDLVLEYSLAMERGDVFPMPVLLLVGRLYVILSGNHRLAAVKLIGISDVQCYVIETSDSGIIEILPRVLNRLHGKRQSKDEAMLHAVYAVDQFGWEPRRAAEMFGLQRDAVSSFIRLRSTRAALEKSGVRTGALKDSHVRDLSAIKNENVQAAAARIATNTAMTTQVLGEFVQGIKTQRTEATQMAVVADWEKKTQPMTIALPVVKVPKAMRSKFVGCLTTIEKYIENVTQLSQLQITEKTEVEIVKQRLSALCEKFGIIIAGRRKQKSR